MPKFKKKPVEIEAIQFTGWDDAKVILDFCGKDADVRVKRSDDGESAVAITIKTLEGDMTAGLNWWIIKGVKGEFYPCRDDIFQETYEKVEN